MGEDDVTHTHTHTLPTHNSDMTDLNVALSNLGIGEWVYRKRGMDVWEEGNENMEYIRASPHQSPQS